jgi:hypothetical protein
MVPRRVQFQTRAVCSATLTFCGAWPITFAGFVVPRRRSKGLEAAGSPPADIFRLR